MRAGRACRRWYDERQRVLYVLPNATTVSSAGDRLRLIAPQVCPWAAIPAAGAVSTIQYPRRLLQLPTLVSIVGASSVRLDGLTFTHTAWTGLEPYEVRRHVAAVRPVAASRAPVVRAGRCAA
jgi:hypothetical protein